jgi:hypothetical protein
MDRYDKEIHVLRWLRLPKTHTPTIKRKAKCNMQLDIKNVVSTDEEFENTTIAVALMRSSFFLLSDNIYTTMLIIDMEHFFGIG